MLHIQILQRLNLLHVMLLVPIFWVRIFLLFFERKTFHYYIGLITFCCAFGITIGTMGKRGEPMLHFFLILNEIVMKLIKLVMWYVNIFINLFKIEYFCF